MPAQTKDKSIGGKGAPVMAMMAMMALAGCASATVSQGIRVEDEALEALARVQAGHAEVLRRLGPPSSTSLEGERAWFYIWWQTRNREPLAPTELAREVVAVHFTEEGRVARTERYGQEDGLDLAYAEGITPPPGDDPNWLMLIINNIGRIIPAGLPSE